MARVTRPGNRPAQERPWFLAHDLKCPVCGAHFRLEPADFTYHRRPGQPGGWMSRTEPTPGGASEATGPCPDCGVRVTLNEYDIAPPVPPTLAGLDRTGPPTIYGSITGGDPRYRGGEEA